MPSTLLEERRYTISDIKLSNPPVPSLKIHKRIFLIEITKTTGGDNEPPKLGRSQGKCIVWSDQILYNGNTDFKIRFKIIMKKENTDESKIIGEYTIAVSNYLSASGICDKKQLGGLSFAIKEDHFKDMLEEAKRKSKGIYFAEGKSWSMLLPYFGLLKQAIDSATSFYPLAHQIWSIVSIVPNVLQANQARTDDVNGLFQELLHIFRYIDEADRLSVLRDTRIDQLRLLIDKTRECVEFIKNYIENNSFVKGVTKGPILDKKISAFKKSFSDIKTRNQDILLLNTASSMGEMASRMGEMTSNMAEMASNMEVFNLRDMPYARDVGLVKNKKCLLGTRETLLKEIEEWVNKENPTERVLILSGQAGTGKSAVAHTIANSLGDQLGSFFCFNRTNKELIKLLFSTISRNVADRNVLWKQNLVQAVKDIAVRTSPDPETQFDEMIIKPSKGTTKRLVIIIDALDESGDQKERKILLPLLFERSSDLPSNYRIIITSRPEHDIARFYQHPNVHCKYMTHIDSTDTQNDIKKFISNELSGIAKTLDAVDADWRYALAHQAQGLFIWARLACVHILELDSFKAAQRLKAILSKPLSSAYKMYHHILETHQECEDADYVDMLKKCVGALIVARKPLSVSDLQDFFGAICGDSKDVKVVLKVLNSLFIGINEPTVKLRPIHASLFDFFLEPEQTSGTPNRYYIKSDQSYFTDACLRVMNRMLRFNICELETSHKRNRDLPNFESRVAQAIPSCLSYACCFWGYHLERSSLNKDLLTEINDLIRIKLLYWFEVLSLLAEIDHGRSAMQILINMTKDTNHELASLAAEASQFLFKFGEMMMESTPHLYLSALPYISKESLISSQFLPQYPHLFSMDVGQPISLRSRFKNSVMQKHPSAGVDAHAFSPQNKQIATSFRNGDLWVWDYITGEMLFQKGPRKGADISDIVFSLNGELVYCCYEHGGILTWEEKTRNVSYEFNEGIAPKGCRSCHISPDGRFVAFVADEAMIFCERETHVKPFGDILANFHRYSNAVMFSSRGRFLGIQPKDEVLRLWDTREKTFVSFGSHTKDHRLKALSDSYIIVRIRDSRVQDREVYDIEVYDIQTKTMVYQFQESFPYFRLGFSPNGEDLFFSGENQCLIRNVSTGKDSRRCLTFGYRVYALSSNATHIAVKYNSTIHVLAWDDLDREEIGNRSEDEDDIKASPLAYQTRGAWHKGQDIILKGARFIRDGDLRVLDPAGTAVLNAAPVIVDDIFHDIFDRGQPLAEVSPENTHWTVAYVDANRPFSLCLWNIDEKEVFTIDESAEPLTILAFSTSGDRLLSCDKKNNIKVWDVRTRTLSSCNRVSSKVTALTFSQTGATFWVAYETDEQAIVEERDSESHKTINGPFPRDLCDRPIVVEEDDFPERINPSIHSIFVSSNDTHICARVEYDNVIMFKLDILDHSTGASINCFNTNHLPVFSPNRKYIAWIPLEDQNKVNLWDMEKDIIGLDGSPFNDEDMLVRCMMFCFSNDSERICVLGPADRTDRVDIWNIQTKNIVAQCLLPSPIYPYFMDKPWRYPMALDGDSLFTVRVDGTAMVWDLRVCEIMTRLCIDHINDPQYAEKFGYLQIRRSIEDYNLHSEDTEVLDYALTAWNKAMFFPWKNSSLIDGWMLGSHGELLFWIPREIRRNLWYPSMSLITTYRGKFTKLCFKHFVHGTRWTECKK